MRSCRSLIVSTAVARAFTLVETLVAIGIIGLLIALLVPVVTHVRESAARTAELSNLRQLTHACLVLAESNENLLPPGRIATALPGYDDYTWLSYESCWSPLSTVIPELRIADASGVFTSRLLSCSSVRDGYADATAFGKRGSGHWSSRDTQVGWMYWAGRDDLYVNGTLRYRSLKRVGQHLTPGSQTLWTCLCWDSAGGGYEGGDASACPHVGSRFVSYPNGVPLKPAPDGLFMSLDDGSASFVRWEDTITIPQANGYKLYYQP